MKKDDVCSELSKRIDTVQEDIFILRSKSDMSEHTQAATVATLEKFDDQLITICQNQDGLSSRMINSFKEHSERLTEIEATTNKIKLVSSNWKTIIWIIIISAIIGFSFETGIRDML